MAWLLCVGSSGVWRGVVVRGGGAGGRGGGGGGGDVPIVFYPKAMCRPSETERRWCYNVICFPHPWVFWAPPPPPPPPLPLLLPILRRERELGLKFSYILFLNSLYLTWGIYTNISCMYFFYFCDILFLFMYEIMYLIQLSYICFVMSLLLSLLLLMLLLLLLLLLLLVLFFLFLLVLPVLLAIVVSWQLCVNEFFLPYYIYYLTPWLLQPLHYLSSFQQKTQ